MKTRTLLLSLFALLGSTLLLAQAKIPVQGIARNANNTAIINSSVNMKFELYFLNGATEVVLQATGFEAISTDAFGVFSYNFLVDTSNAFAVEKHPTILRITLDDNTVISDELLGDVPYALVARNGVPPGTIMAYVGATAPSGWSVCDGSTIPTGNVEYDAVRALLPTGNFPDLRGMFIRGAGTNGLTSQNTTLNGIQDDTFLSHSHADNFSIATGGSHTHLTRRTLTNVCAQTGGCSANPYAFVPSNPNASDISTFAAGSHSHTLNGSITASGSNESRPVNYGVTYIIKL